ncbi:MAG: restriction endonuclease subunit S [Nitrosospira sp.]|nr:restriction endonuclease subunit S [Nitrosospira sp.]
MVKVAEQLARAQHFGTRSVGVRLGELVNTGIRLESSAYALEARQAVIELQTCSYQLKALLGNGGICRDAHNAFRFKRIYVGPEQGVPFLSSSDIIGLRPERGGYLSKKHTSKLQKLQIKPWDVLVSRSGTIGNISLASPRIADWVLSEDVIRLAGPDPDTAGYVTAFLRSRWGRAKLMGMTYGSVVQHIEAHHLQHVLIPELPAIRRIEIGRAFVNAAKKRDEANDLMDEADTQLCVALKLPSLLNTKKGPQISTIHAAAWGNRFDASFHNPGAYWVKDQLQQLGLPVLPLGNPKLTQAIRAVTKFRKRVYVPHGGIPLLSSKQLFQIDPIGVKRLAKGAHEGDLDEIALEPNMVILTCSGTIGRVQIVPSYMKGWAANQHAIRIVTGDDLLAGYLYAWLASDYGQKLITRYSYGSVILEIDRFMVAKIPVPVLPSEEINEIAKLVLDANRLRDEAWNLEQEALKVLDGEIASKS